MGFWGRGGAFFFPFRGKGGEKEKEEKKRKLTTHAHQLLGQAEASMGPHHAQARDVAVLNAVGGLLFHLGEHVADDFGGGAGAGGGDVEGDVGEGGPGEGMVEVVFKEVVFGQVGDVGLLDVGDVGGVEDADVHFLGLGGGKNREGGRGRGRGRGTGGFEGCLWVGRRERWGDVRVKRMALILI